MTSTNEQDLLTNVTNTYNKNKKKINQVGLIVLGLITSYFAYQYFVVKPKAEKATKSVHMAQYMYENQNYKIALEGQPGAFEGFKSIIKKYSGTPEGNLAKFYAGDCELKLQNFDQAIKYLKDFDGNGSLLEARANGCIGDAYAEKEKWQDAIEYYQKASKDDKDQVNSPIYLQRLGLVYEKTGSPEKAIETYKNLKSNFPTSTAASEVDKFLARLGIIK